MAEEKKETSQVILTVGPKGRLVKGGIEFTGNAASLASGGRLTNWLPQIIIAAKRYRTEKHLKRKYDFDKAEAEKAKIIKPESKSPAKADSKPPVTSAKK